MMIVGLLIVLVGFYLVFANHHGVGVHGVCCSHSGTGVTTGAALDTLKQRYAKGEITQEEFLNIKKELES